MPADSGHWGRDRKDKVVPLRRHTTVTEIEERLLEARRLFSLRDYRACDKVALEVLRRDPQNSKAKALLDLVAIKLTNAKHTVKTGASHTSEKTSEPAKDKDSQQQSLPATQDSEDRASAGNTPPEREQDLRESASLAEAPDSGPMELLPAATSSEPMSQKDSLRERTISALVDLFQRKDLSLADWKDPRFQPDGQPVAEKTQKAEQKARTKSKRSIEFLPVEDQQSLPTEVPENRVEVQKSRDVPDIRKAPSEKTGSVSKLEAPAKPSYQQLVARKFEERSEDLRKSEIRTISIAQIKKYLYQEEYELCAQELDNIRMVFPENSEIQVFVENTFRRLAELQRIKNLEHQSRELMSKATNLYQEGKLPEALDSAQEALRLVPNHQQARDFVAFVHKRIEKEKKKTPGGIKSGYCWYCGVTVNSISRFCFHCGQRLT